jgi:hypothetical protein
MPTTGKRPRWRISRVALALSLYTLVSLGGAAILRWLCRAAELEFYWVAAWMAVLILICCSTYRERITLRRRVAIFAIAWIGHQVASLVTMVILLMVWPRLLRDLVGLEQSSSFLASLPFAVFLLRRSTRFSGSWRSPLGPSSRSTSEAMPLRIAGTRSAA